MVHLLSHDFYFVLNNIKIPWFGRYLLWSTIQDLLGSPVLFNPVPFKENNSHNRICNCRSKSYYFIKMSESTMILDFLISWKKKCKRICV